MDKTIFLRAQDENRSDYQNALLEIRSGRKRSCWIWYVFPILNVSGLTVDYYSEYFALSSLGDAYEYFADPVLRERLIEITSAVLSQNGEIENIMGSEIDKLKLWSCMTLFRHISPETSVFSDVIEKFYGGIPHEPTVLRIADEIRNK